MFYICSRFGECKAGFRMIIVIICLAKEEEDAGQFFKLFSADYKTKFTFCAGIRKVKQAVFRNAGEQLAGIYSPIKVINH